MDVETLLRLAKKQPWWNAFMGNLKSVTPERLAKRAIENNDYVIFFSNAFLWKNTKEGFGYWNKIVTDFCKTVWDYEKSIPVFRAYENNILVARFVGWVDRQPGDLGHLRELAAKTLEDNNIAFDLVVTDNDEIKAYRYDPYFVRE